MVFKVRPCRNVMFEIFDQLVGFAEKEALTGAVFPPVEAFVEEWIYAGRNNFIKSVNSFPVWHIHHP